MSDPSYWVWLQEGLGYASPTASALLAAGIDPADLYHMSYDEIQQLCIFSPNQIMKLKMASLDTAKQICEDCAKQYYTLLTPDMGLYPERLLSIEDPPVVLYVEGEANHLEALDEIPTISIIGSRKMSSYGCRIANNLSYDLAKAGFIIISGLALGIDAQAHTGTIKAGGKTIAVLGCGLDVNYPTQNSELRKAILHDGAILTEYPPKTAAIGRNFPVRNRIISGLSLGVVVVEANKFSGSLITVGHALAQGRDVFAVPTDIFDPNGEGVLKLIQDGAKPIMSAYDIMSEYLGNYAVRIAEEKMTNTTVTDRMVKPKKLEPERESKGKTKSSESAKGKSLPPYLTEQQKTVYQLLKADPIGVELLVQSSGFAIYEILSIMTELEIYGLAKAYPGKRFSL